jgi:hypothetical protein
LNIIPPVFSYAVTHVASIRQKFHGKQSEVWLPYNIIRLASTTSATTPTHANIARKWLRRIFFVPAAAGCSSPLKKSG